MSLISALPALTLPSPSSDQAKIRDLEERHAAEILALKEKHQRDLELAVAVAVRACLRACVHAAVWLAGCIVS